jgi:peptidyl-prolyl cis-trans isomerase SurA
MKSWLVALGAAAVAVALAADIRVVEEIAAKVNGDIITRGELEQTRREIEQGLRAEGLTGAKLQEAVRQYSANALRDQIDQLLLVQRAKDLTINIDPEITRELASLQVRSKIADPDKFREYVREQTGMTYEEYRDRMRRQYLAQRVIGQEVGRQVNIPEAEQVKYYEEHKEEFVRKEQVFLSLIMISTEGKTPEQVKAAEAKSKDVTARARKGEKFSDLVRDFSDDAETAKNGGSLPPFERGMQEKAIEDIVFKERKGYVTDPIKIPQGYAILRVDERYDAGQATFEEVRNEIQDRLARPKMEPKIREFLTRLRSQAFLEIKDGYVDSGAAPGKDTRWHDVAQIKPRTTTKEEVASRIKDRKRLIFIPIPGTRRPAGQFDSPPPEETAAPAPPAAATPAPVK